MQVPEPWWLKQSALAYKKLLGNPFCFLLADGTKILLRFRKNNYYHLIGLHKFGDVQNLILNPARGITQLSIYNDILQGNISEYDLHKSKFYNFDIERRMKGMLSIDTYIFNSTEVVIPFDTNLVFGTSRIPGDAIILSFSACSSVGDERMHLFIKKEFRKNIYVPMSMFFSISDRYIANQRTLAIVNVKREGKRQ